MAKFNLSFLLHVSLVLAFATSSNANAFGPHHRDLARLARKRGPADASSNQPPQPSQPPQPTQPALSILQPSPTTPANSATAQTSSEPASASSSNNPPTTNGASSSTANGATSTNSQAASSSASASSPASGASSNTPQTSAQAGTTPAAAPSKSASQSVLYLTASGSGAPAQTSSSSSDDTSSSMSHAAMTVIIVIAASIGAAVIVWNIIRKWKFRPSSDFEGRMQPIDWQPDGSNDEGGFPGQGTLSRASSFHSGPNHSGHADEHVQGGYSGPPVLNPIPDHDFTAGPAHLAPVGGYADLARGPSLQPVMQEPLGSAPSINRPVQYDQYGVPLHHGYNGY